jgi:hypothetical protein
MDDGSEGKIICGEKGVQLGMLNAAGGRRLCIVTTTDDDEGRTVIVNLENRTVERLIDELTQGLNFIRSRHGRE